MRRAAEELHLPAIRPDGAHHDVGRQAPIVVESHDRLAERVAIDMTAAPQAAFLAYAEQQRDRRMVELLPEQLGRERREHAATGPVVAAERGLRRVDDLAALPLRPGAGAQRHRIHVRHEQQPRLIAERAGSRKIDDQVSGLGRHRYPLVRVIEPDRALRHAGRPQRRADLAPDQCLAAGDAFDREKSHQALDGGVGVDGHGVASFNDRFCRGPAGSLNIVPSGACCRTILPARFRGSPAPPSSPPPGRKSSMPHAHSARPGSPPC